MAPSSELSLLLSRFDSLPERLRLSALGFVIGRKIPFVSTAGLKIEELSASRVVMSIRNRRRVQNHFKGIHAVAMALLTETATGFALGMHLPGDKIPLLKTLKIDYLRRVRGGLTATAELRPAQIEDIRSLERGEISVPVTVTDQTQANPIQCELIWTWVPRRRPSGSSPLE